MNKYRMDIHSDFDPLDSYKYSKAKDYGGSYPASELQGGESLETNLTPLMSTLISGVMIWNISRISLVIAVFLNDVHITLV